MLVEPTSAVDAHTEARIAERLAAARSGAGATGAHDRGDHEPAAARPRRRGRVPRRRPGGRARHPPRPARPPPGLPRDRDPHGEADMRPRRDVEAASASTPPRCRSPPRQVRGAHAYAAVPMHRTGVATVVALNGVAAIAALAGPRILGIVVEAVRDAGITTSRDQRPGADPRRGRHRADGVHAMGAAEAAFDPRRDGVRPSCARTSSSACRRAAPVDRRARRHRRPRHPQRPPTSTALSRTVRFAVPEVIVAAVTAVLTCSRARS